MIFSAVPPPQVLPTKRGKRHRDYTIRIVLDSLNNRTNVAVTVTISDVAIPPNKVSFTRTITLDTLPPQYDPRNSVPRDINAVENRVAIHLRGVITDSTSNIKSAFLYAAYSDDRNEPGCSFEQDDQLSRDRAAPVRLDDDTKSVTFDETIVIKRGEAGDRREISGGQENLCVILRVSDTADNRADYAAARFTAYW